MSAIQPLKMDNQTVTLSRADWDHIHDMLDEIADREAILKSETRRKQLGDEQYRRLNYTAEEAIRILDGVSLVTIWRERAGLSQVQLAREAGIGAAYLNDLEKGRKRGSLEAFAKIAKALALPISIFVGD